MNKVAIIGYGHVGKSMHQIFPDGLLTLAGGYELPASSAPIISGELLLARFAH